MTLAVAGEPLMPFGWAWTCFVGDGDRWQCIVLRRMKLGYNRSFRSVDQCHFSVQGGHTVLEHTIHAEKSSSHGLLGK